MLRLILPFPPSINHYWVHARGRTFISDEGRRYRRTVIMLAKCGLKNPGILPLKSRLSLDIILYPADRRRRDLDNSLKSLLDALQHAGVYQDDAQIDELRIRRGELTSSPEARIMISTIGREKDHVQQQA
jgi:crossover junction endodeoxyribonuclease RusA